VGLPIPNVGVCIIDPADARALPPGVTGEVVVRRRFPPAGYLGHAADRADTFSATAIRTGDLGFLDDEGALTLTGRIKAMINVAGAKVAPREVEDALLRHPAVRDAAAFGVPSPELGEAVAAVVVTAGAVSERALIAHCRTVLSAYKVPSTIHFVPELPRTPTGKPDLARIRQTDTSGGSLERLKVSL
jgi:long-chain acyl-CoA synthetase